MERQGTMRRLVGALLRRMAERVDPQPKPTVIHMMPGNSDIAEKIRAEFERLRTKHSNGTGLA